MILSFGKYKGRNLNRVPTPYLRWLLRIELQGQLRREVIFEAVGRGTVDTNSDAHRLVSQPEHIGEILLRVWERYLLP